MEIQYYLTKTSDRIRELLPNTLRVDIDLYVVLLFLTNGFGEDTDSTMYSGCFTSLKEAKVESN